MNYASIIIPFVGGLGMFIYGMQIMAQGLENAAGSRMKSLLEALTKNKLFGVMLGAFITAVIQSSSATTVMVVGFVNAGIMNLSQAMGVIMGANIGTTVTGWLVSSVEWAKKGKLAISFRKNSRKEKLFPRLQTSLKIRKKISDA